jgi:hypothetical protein
MTKFLSLAKSDKPEKKYRVHLLGNSGREKVIYFGDSSLKDYTLFNAKERDERRRLYLQRHAANENWDDPESAGFWSRWLLWGPYPSVSKNLKYTINKYKL